METLKQPEPMITVANAYDAKCELTQPTLVAQMSWHSTVPSLTFGAENLRRYLEKSIENLLKPEFTDLDCAIDLVNGFEKFIPADQNRTSCEAISEWIAQNATEERPTIAAITGDAHFVADSELLSKIAQTPYVVEEQKEWTVEAFRVQNTVFLFKGGDLQQRDKARLLESYQREMFRRKFTQEGQDQTKAVNANDAYHRLLAAELGIAGDNFRILYAAPISAIDSDDNAVDMRVDCDAQHDERWYAKALRWYVEARLSGSTQIDVANVEGGRANGKTRLPLQWLADDARNGEFWRAHVAFTFLFDVLARLRKAARECSEGQVVAAVYHRSAYRVEFKRYPNFDQTLPVSESFWSKFVEPPAAGDDGWNAG